MIKLNSVTKSYGKKVIIENYNLQVDNQDFILIYGASGSGKTTLLNLIGSLEKPDRGNVEYIYDKVYNTKKKYNYIRKNYVSYIFQNFALLQGETVLNNLMFALKESKLSKSEKFQMIDEELKKVNMHSRIKSYIYELSGGEQQRIALVRAVLKPHKVILADEPTGNLDKENVRIVMDYLRQLNEAGETIIVVSHDESIKGYANRIEVLG